MNQSTVDRIKEFTAYAEEFQEIWRTLLLRAAWFEAEGAPRLLLLSIRLKPDEPSRYPKPAVSPEIEEYKIAWEARPIARLRETLAELAAGKIEVEGVSLKWEYKSGSSWKEIGSPFISFECPGVHNPHEKAHSELSMFAGDLGIDPVYERVMDRTIESKWRGLPAPFWNRQDVLRNFFEIDRGGDLPPENWAI